MLVFLAGLPSCWDFTLHEVLDAHMALSQVGCWDCFRIFLKLPRSNDCGLQGCFQTFPGWGGTHQLSLWITEIVSVKHSHQFRNPVWAGNWRQSRSSFLLRKFPQSLLADFFGMSSLPEWYLHLSRFSQGFCEIGWVFRSRLGLFLHAFVLLQQEGSLGPRALLAHFLL